MGLQCLKKPPSNWIECGPGASKDRLSCEIVKSKPILRFSFLAFDIVRIGIAVETLAVYLHATISTNFTQQLKEKWVELKKQYDSDPDVREIFTRNKKNTNSWIATMTYNAEKVLSSTNPNVYNIIDSAADIVAIFGPTATSLRTGANIAYEMCSNIQF